MSADWMAGSEYVGCGLGCITIILITVCLVGGVLMGLAIRFNP